MPRQPSRTPITSWPCAHERRATARMTAFRPGQSPPPVRIPIFIPSSRVYGRSTRAQSVPPQNRGVAIVVLALMLLLHSHAGGPSLHDAAPCAGVTGYTCSTLDVPLDRTGRQTGVLHLRVGAADNVKAPRGVLLVLSGGPGQPGVFLLDRFVDKALAAEKETYRIVVFDQRGTGGGALDCEAMQQQMGASDLYPPTVAAVRACAAKLGDRRQFFGTDDVVADIDALRRALGVDRIALDGVSYGTYVGERYALAHPGHVSKLVLDSVV